jgi:hypothetical protein
VLPGIHRQTKQRPETASSKARVHLDLALHFPKFFGEILFRGLGLVVHIYNTSTQEPEYWYYRCRRIMGSLGYIARPCLKKEKEILFRDSY